MKRYTVSLLLFLLVSCSSVTITPTHLRNSSLADHRRQAAQLIAEDRLKSYLPDLIVALKSDPSPIVRAQSAVAIGKLGIQKKQVYKALSDTLKSDPDPIVQQDVIYALTELNYTRSLPLLKKKIRSSSYSEVRVDAASAIKKLGNPSDADVLIEGLSDKNYMVRHACLDALQELSNQDGPLDPSWWENNLKAG